MSDWDLLITDINIATMVKGNSPYGIIENGALAINGNTIAWLGESKSIPKINSTKKISMPGKWITPALIDCHTHLVFAGNRAWEFEERIKGKSYQEISSAGGGIISTVNATRNCDIKALTALS